MYKYIKRNVLMLLSLLLILACSKEKTDEQLLELDRQNLLESIKSPKVNTYRFGIIGIRSSRQDSLLSSELENINMELDVVSDVLLDLRKSDDLSIKELISLAKAYKGLNEQIQDIDEDQFPTLFEALTMVYGDSIAKSLPLLVDQEKVIAQNMEHALLSALVTLSSSLGREVALYESSKTNPNLLPDSELKEFLQYFRAFLFIHYKLYYLAELEASANINWLEKNPNISLPYTAGFFGWGLPSEKEKCYTSAHALNYLFRGIIRLLMERDIDTERAMGDFEVFLEDAKELNLQNESVWLVESYYYLKTKNFIKAIESLRKLHDSHMLSSKERKIISQSIEYLENRDYGKILNGAYDKVFMSKIATKYFVSVLSEVDWQSIMEEQNFQYSQELIQLMSRIEYLSDKIVNQERGELLQDVGGEIKEGGNKLRDKAKDLF